MKVHAQLYAQLRDVAGVDAVNVDLADNASVSDLLHKIYAKFPALAAHDKNILVGAGGDFVDRDYKLNADDDVSIMPPVQGG